MAAYGEGEHGIGRRHVRAAVQDTPAAGSFGPRPWWIALGVGLACIVTGIGWVLAR
jgi:hypothetical protein